MIKIKKNKLIYFIVIGIITIFLMSSISALFLYSPNSTIKVFNPNVSQPSGFSLSYNTIDVQNYTLPNFSGTKFTYNSTTNYNVPVITKYSPIHYLTTYYVNTSFDLVAYNMSNTNVKLLHSFVFFTYTLGVNEVNGYQNSNGSLQFIFSDGYNSNGILYLEQYNLYNGTYNYVNTGFYYTSASNTGAGLFGNNGWWYINTESLITMFNIYTKQVINLTIPNTSNWNSQIYVPAINQVVEDLNNYANYTIEFAVFNFTNSVINYRTFYSSAYSFITGYDENNMPYFVKTLSNGTTYLWGIGENSVGSGGYYHVVTLYLYSDMSKDVFDYVSPTGSVGTDDNSAGVFIDTSGYYLNGYEQTNATAQYQSPFLNPLNKSTVYSSNNAWLNTYLTTHNIGYIGNGNGWVSQFQYFSYTGYSNAYVIGSTITYYWMPSFTSQYSPSVNTINKYNVYINESGLPVGTNWIMTFNGTQHSTTLNNFNLSEPNGTYSFSVSSINGYTVSYPSSITVSGSSQTINVVFHKIATYKVELLESGLPSGTQWNYTFNSNNQVLGNNSYNYSLSNGSYSIYVGSISGYSLHYANPVVVNGHNVIEYINYSLIPTYSVIIKESGLATNTKWYALINDIQYSSTTAYINLSGLTNSTYTLAINNIAGYLLNSYPSSFIINGKNAYINITFTSDNKLSSISVIAKDVKDISSITWSVVFNGTTYNSQNSNTIVIPSLQNGTYSFKVNSISGYKINSYPSSITIAGKNITENITFNQTFVLYVKESGYNQEWFINLNGTQYSSTNSYINVSGLVNYTYSFSVPQVVGYTTSSYPHSVVINGNNYYINITFTFQIFPNGKYEIVFVMTGLPKNTNWTVVINGIQHFSNGSKYINITLTNGTYYPEFILPNNYELTNSPPVLNVNGQAEYYSVYANYSFNWYNYTPEFAIVLLFIGVLLIPAVVKRRG